MQGTPNYRLRRTVENFALYLTTAIVLIVIAFPAYWLVTTAIKYDIDAFVTPPIILPLRGTLDNFRLVLNAPDIGRFFANSVIVALTSTGVAILLGSLAAYALAKSYLAFTLRQTAMIWILVTRIFPPVTTAIPYFIIIRNLGLSDTHFALILTHTAYALPFVIWLMLGFFQDLPEEIEKAAIVDGCSLWQRFSQVVLPLTLPGIAVTAIFTFIYSWNEFLYASMLTSINAKTLPVVISGYMSDKFLRWGEMSALASLMILPVMIFAAFTQRYLVRGLTFGAVKE
ncbi:MAG: carbohydrate ABC transporter permease [Caldilineaceae bacterium]|nr:carbohydrate ABC transporter permease [Caldilineaceae bacterium]